MKLLHIPTPRRLLNVFASQRAPVNRVVEPLLGFDNLPPPPPAAPQPLGRRAIEMALEEGSRRLYVPMAEEEVIERPRRR
ncbi:hypothetical protein ACG04R_06750 [Roseateles sp. BYS78W]|uniref:Uncharacterized protein n=1 Tax=Pelomonas candidula TaxID=3299025 RepID=A0ABW7H8W4_9BURK